MSFPWDSTWNCSFGVSAYSKWNNRGLSQNTSLQIQTCSNNLGCLLGCRDCGLDFFFGKPFRDQVPVVALVSSTGWLVDLHRSRPDQGDSLNHPCCTGQNHCFTRLNIQSNSYLLSTFQRAWPFLSPAPFSLESLVPNRTLVIFPLVCARLVYVEKTHFEDG